jgi:NDP-sugar pyrophosphorylase family protein
MAPSSLRAADVPCVILVGGRATRMLPDTERRPKFLLPVAGEPFAAHQLGWLSSEGVRHVVIAIGHLGEMVQQYIGDGAAFGLDVSYSSDGAQPLGTGGALRKAVDDGEFEGPVMVLYGDSFLSVTVNDVIARYFDFRLPALMVVYENRAGLDRSNAAFDGRTVRYAKGLPDPAGAGFRFVDYGLSIFDTVAIREYVTAGANVDLATVQAELSRDGKLAGYQAVDRFYEIGSPRGLADLDRYLRERR